MAGRLLQQRIHDLQGRRTRRSILSLTRFHPRRTVNLQVGYWFPYEKE